MSGVSPAPQAVQNEEAPLKTLARSLVLLAALALPLAACNNPASQKSDSSASASKDSDGKNEKASKEDRKATADFISRPKDINFYAKKEK